MYLGFNRNTYISILESVGANGFFGAHFISSKGHLKQAYFYFESNSHPVIKLKDSTSKDLHLEVITNEETFCLKCKPSFYETSSRHTLFVGRQCYSLDFILIDFFFRFSILMSGSKSTAAIIYQGSL
jgi:hypothetical protein